MPVATYAPLAGKRGRVTVNGAVLNLDAHEIRHQGDDIDTTHFESDTGVLSSVTNVFEEGIVGIVGAELMVRGSWDGLNNPHAGPVYLFPGLFGTAFLGLTKAFGYTVAYRCLSTPTSTAVRGKSGFEARLKSNGVYTLPSGTTS